WTETDSDSDIKKTTYSSSRCVSSKLPWRIHKNDIKLTLCCETLQGQKESILVIDHWVCSFMHTLLAFFQEQKRRTYIPIIGHDVCFDGHTPFRCLEFLQVISLVVAFIISF